MNRNAFVVAAAILAGAVLISGSILYTGLESTAPHAAGAI